MKKVALVGLGRWGRKLLRELTSAGAAVTVVLRALDTEKESWLAANFPEAWITYALPAVVEDQSISHACIATPMQTHAAMARAFAPSRKRVFLEKPITDEAATAEEALALYEGQQRLMVGHIFLYHECFARLRQELQGAKMLGVEIRKSSRTGESVRASKAAFLDAFIHEVSILLALFGVPRETTLEGEELRFRFDTFEARVRTEPPAEEKVRRLEFKTEAEILVWNNDELSRGGEVILVPERPALARELDIFLDHFEEFREEIRANNAIAVDCVRVLEEVWLRS
jgi:predicted dehydrogenase